MHADRGAPGGADEGETLDRERIGDSDRELGEPRRPVARWIYERRRVAATGGRDRKHPEAALAPGGAGFDQLEGAERVQPVPIDERRALVPAPLPQTESRDVYDVDHSQPPATTQITWPVDTC